MTDNEPTTLYVVFRAEDYGEFDVAKPRIICSSRECANEWIEGDLVIRTAWLVERGWSAEDVEDWRVRYRRDYEIEEWTLDEPTSDE